MSAGLCPDGVAFGPTLRAIGWPVLSVTTRARQAANPARGDAQVRSLEWCAPLAADAATGVATAATASTAPAAAAVRVSRDIRPPSGVHGTGARSRSCGWLAVHS